MRPINHEWAIISLWKLAESHPKLLLDYYENDIGWLLRTTESKVKSAIQWLQGSISRGADPDSAKEIAISMLGPYEEPKTPPTIQISEQKMNEIYKKLVSLEDHEFISNNFFGGDKKLEIEENNTDILKKSFDYASEIIDEGIYEFNLFCLELIKRYDKKVIHYLKSVYFCIKYSPGAKDIKHLMSDDDYVISYNTDFFEVNLEEKTYRIGTMCGNTHLLLIVNEKELSRINELLNSESLNDGESITSERRFKIISQAIKECKSEMA